MAAPVAPIVLGSIGAVTLVAGAVVAGLVLDTAVLVSGRPRPLTGGRQVPREWTRLLDSRVVAVLFGARLGVGPLTILSTWVWWSMHLAAGVLGLGPAVAVGATFGLVRMVIIVVASLRAEHGGHATWFGRLRARQRPGWAVLNGVGFAIVAAAGLAACGTAEAPRLVAVERPNDEVTSALGHEQTHHDAPIDGSAPTGDTAALLTGPDGLLNPLAFVGGQPPPAVEPVATDDMHPTLNPAQLEDFVRPPHADPTDPNSTSLEPSEPPASLDDGGAASPSHSPSALAGALSAEIDGFAAIDDPAADRFLDLRSASEVQPDPTEEIALLETRGFRGGWTRAFRSESNDVAIASVYQFADAAQAEFYLEDGLITIGGYGGAFFDIEGLPGVRGFRQTFTDDGEDLVSLGAAFQAGPRWYLVSFVGSPETVTPTVLVPAVTELRDRHLGPTEPAAVSP